MKFVLAAVCVSGFLASSGAAFAQCAGHGNVTAQTPMTPIVTADTATPPTPVVTTDRVKG